MVIYELHEEYILGFKQMIAQIKKNLDKTKKNGLIVAGECFKKNLNRDVDFLDFLSLAD